MPYLDRDEEGTWIESVERLAGTYVTAPRLAYAIARLAKEALIDQAGGNEFSPSYTNMATIDGVLGTAQMEFRERVIKPYEKKKRKENGGIYDV